MTTGIAGNLRACAELIRLDLAFGAGFFVVAGQVLALGGLPPADMAFFGFVMLFFISGSANISNDYFDREVDRVNLPGRPLPSGRVSVRGLWALFAVCTATGLAAAASFGPLVLGLAIVFWALPLFYNMKIKEYGIAGNLVVATCVGMTIVFGGITAGSINGLVLTFGLLAFLFDLGEEVAADAMDVKGDEVRSSRSLAKSRGRGFALRLSAVFFWIFWAVTVVPFAAGWLGYDYLALVTALDLFMVWCVIKLVRDRSTEEGREQVKRLYLSWGIFMVLFVIARLLV